MMWMKLTSFMLCLNLILSACSSRLQERNWTPAQAAIGKHKPGQKLQLLGQRKDPFGKLVVLHTVLEPSREGDMCQFSLSYAIIELNERAHLYVSHAHLSSRPINCQPTWTTPITTALFEGEYTAVYGPIFTKSATTVTEEVKSIEADFSDGTSTVEEEPQDYFLIFSPPGAKVCKLRVYGPGDEIIYRYDWSKHLNRINPATCS
jgi:hypothetical protein